LVIWLMAAAACTLSASPGFAGTLTSASWTQAAQGFPLTRTAGDPRWSFSGVSTAAGIAVNVNYFFTSTFFGAPGTPLDLGIHLTQGGSQAITATRDGAGGSPRISGLARVAGGFPVHAGMGANQSMFRLGASTIVSVPFGVGNAGVLTHTFQALGVHHTITVNFYSWTPASLSFRSLTYVHSQVPSVSAGGSFSLTANGGGLVTLVSPSVVNIDGSLAQRRTVFLTTLVLHFVPEPASLLLLSGGALALGLANRRPAASRGQAHGREGTRT
jgi:hypothetical protein